MRRVLPYIALTLFVVQLLLMLVSWLWSAAFPMSGVRSLLSSEGLRWFLGGFADLLATPLLVWLLLLSMSVGCLMRSGVRLQVSTLHSPAFGYRERRALLITLLLLLVYIGAVLLLALLPHAVLLSATGALWPSPFSASLVPVTAFGMVLLSSVYGMIAGRFNSLADIYDSLLYGIRLGAPLPLFYVLLFQIYKSLRFVLPSATSF